MTPPLRLVLATANPHKLHEIEEILRSSLSDVVLIARPSGLPDVEENGATLYDNARLKAEAICKATATTSVADDTGLFVDALDGAPGVYSARYAGEDATYGENVRKLLDALLGVTNRRAVFRTVAVALFPNGEEVVATGEVVGRIALGPQGDDGFGYDPVFVPDDAGERSFAQLSPEEKNAISHRGRALRDLAQRLTGHQGNN